MINQSMLTHMSGSEVGNDVKFKTPPNVAIGKYVTCDPFESFGQVNTVVELGDELKREGQQKGRHDQSSLFLYKQFWHN